MKNPHKNTKLLKTEKGNEIQQDELDRKELLNARQKKINNPQKQFQMILTG